MADAAMIALRFALFADLMAMFGIAAFGLYALAGDERRSGELMPFAWILFAAAVSGGVLSSAAIAMMAAQMSGVTLIAVDFPTIGMVVADTPMGRAWCVRMLCLAIAAIATVKVRASPGLMLTILVGAGFAALTTLAWAGHGAMDDGAPGWIHLLADISHLAAAGLWVGALLSFVWLLLFRSDRVELLRRVLERFSAMGTAIVLILLATGIANGLAVMGMPALAALQPSLYARLLLAKLVLFVLMLGLAALNRLRLTPALSARGGVGALRLSILTETAVGFAILLLVAWLGTLAPPVSP